MPPKRPLRAHRRSAEPLLPSRTFRLALRLVLSWLSHDTLVSRPSIFMAIAARRLFKPALKGTREAPRMFIPHGAGDFLDAQVAVSQQPCRLFQSLLREHVLERKPRGLFEQVSKIGLTEVESQRPVLNVARRFLFNHLHEFAKAPILKARDQRDQVGGVV